jgi:hypothetical protein
MPWSPFLQFEATDVQGEFAEQQGVVVGVAETTIVAQTGHARVAEFPVHNSQQVAHLGDGCLVLNHVTDPQPVL